MDSRDNVAGKLRRDPEALKKTSSLGAMAIHRQDPRVAYSRSVVALDSRGERAGLPTAGLVLRRQAVCSAVCGRYKIRLLN